MTNKAAIALVALALTLAGACGDDDGATNEPQGAATKPPGLVECAPDSIEVTEGLCYVEHEVGNGPEAKKGDVVEVDYTGTLTDGTQFDSSEGRGPLEFTLGIGQVIEGWDLGIEGMKVGGSRTLTIGPDLAYGEAGFPPDIPPDATLIFDVELVSVKSG